MSEQSAEEKDTNIDAPAYKSGFVPKALIFALVAFAMSLNGDSHNSVRPEPIKIIDHYYDSTGQLITVPLALDTLGLNSIDIAGFYANLSRISIEEVEIRKEAYLNIIKFMYNLNTHVNDDSYFNLVISNSDGKPVVVTRRQYNGSSSLIQMMIFDWQYDIALKESTATPYFINIPEDLVNDTNLMEYAFTNANNFTVDPPAINIPTSNISIQSDPRYAPVRARLSPTGPL